MAETEDIKIWSGQEWISLEGPKGETGAAASITVGTTTTLPCEDGTVQDAVVENVGTAQAAVLNFSVPAGCPGEAGNDGNAATIQVGDVKTNQLVPGSDCSVVINNTGDQNAAVLDFTFGLAQGPKGEDGTGVTILGQLQNPADNPVIGPPTQENTQGHDICTDGPGSAWLDKDGDLWVWNEQTGDCSDDNPPTYINAGSIQGPPGSPGNAATVSATASATKVGPDEDATASVQNNGTAQAAQFAFAFNIPQGEKGETGSPGSNGEDGANCEVYVQSDQPTALAPGAIWIQTV